MAYLKKLFYPLLVLMILGVSLRGIFGVPTSEELVSPEWKEEGPFELSPERGRFALIYSLAEDKSFHFSVPVARFVTPDLGYWKGNYVSLLAPGVSLVALPGYILGKAIGMSQLGAFAVIAIFAMLNAVLIRKIAVRLGANTKAGNVAGILFLFATPAYSYALSLYQHHISSFILLLGILLVTATKKSWRVFFMIWFLAAFSLMVDNPNLFLFFPVGFAALAHAIDVKDRRKKVNIILRPKIFLAILGALVPVGIFALVNYFSYGNPSQLAGTVPYVAHIDSEGKPFFPEESGLTIEDLQNAGAQSSVGFFDPRNLVNGLYVHLFSVDRGVVFFAPVILFGLVGAYALYKKQEKGLPLLVFIVLLNLILYSMWGDPWGGWAFGSRYLIPSYAIMAVFAGIALTKYARKKLFVILFGLVMVYSIAVNTLGAITTSANPPKIQAIPLQEITGKTERYSWDRNWEYLNTFGSKSFFYREFVDRQMDAKTYYFMLVGILSAVTMRLLYANYITKNKNK